MNTIELVDIKTKPDIVHEYAPSLRADSVPLIIDNGSYKCRVGWGNNNRTLLEFRNLIAKPRKDRKKDIADSPGNPPIQIGNDIVNIEALRMQLKTQFDRNIVTHFHNQEQIFDYIFSHLNIDCEGSVSHPILLTEALGNPNYCRQQMNELLFECYSVPSVSYGVDALFSIHHNRDALYRNQDALIISFGYHTTHIVPVIDGCLYGTHARRINIGGYHIISYLYRLMQMKYPVHLNAITISRIETLLHNHCGIVVDYQAELKRWAQPEFYTANVKKIQLPFIAPIPSVTLTPEQKTEKRKELARRLFESNMRRAKEKQIEDEEQLEIMTNIRQLHERGNVKDFQAALKENKMGSLQELDELISLIRNRLERKKVKLNSSTENSPKEKTSAAAKIPAEVSLEDWISDIRKKKDIILKAKQVRKNRRVDLAKRHTAAAQERMRIISLLARNEKGTDEFGIDDGDWDVYKVINRENDSDSETENEKLLEYENILRQYDPTYEESPLVADIAAEHYQLHVGVELIRAPELLFQPSMIGSSESGLAELINYVLKLFPADDQQRLANNIFLTGGCAHFPGLEERLTKELREIRPFQTTFEIYKATSPDIDAWLGAKNFANSSHFAKSLTSKKDYDEYGSEYFRTHRGSNPFFPSPK